jgi:hypothetical protein
MDGSLQISALAAQGKLPGHPKGKLNPEWIEQAMGYYSGWTEVAEWVMPFIRRPHVRHSSDFQA